MRQTDYVITEHALFEMKRRGLTEEMVHMVMSSPGQRVDVRPGRVVMQTALHMAEPEKTYLIRVIVDVDREPAEVVTVYRTSRISKYWRQEP